MTAIPAGAPAPRPTTAVAALLIPKATASVVPDGSAYGDMIWDLTPLSGRPTARWLTIDFSRAPEPVRESLRHFIYLVLTTDTPIGALERPVSTRARLTPTSVKALWEDLSPFLDWLDERGTQRIADLDEHDLRHYAQTVQDAPVTQPTRGRRLFAVTRLWLYAPYLRPEARLIQPFWERDGVAEILGPNQWSPENKTPPIHPATMSALLVWCLRILEDAPAVVAQHAIGTTPTAPAPADHALAWLDPPTATNPRRSRQLLSAASLIVTAYLTGMRADEVLALRRGCCTPAARGGFTIRGRTFKSAVVNGRAVAEGLDREHPWVAIKPVADAITAMENLHDSSLIFPGSLFRRTRQAPVNDTPPASNARGVAIEALIGWANTRATQLGRDHEAIPEDPDGAVSLRRLRRTLAWFIYRRPRGRVALGIQYGHLHAGRPARPVPHGRNSGPERHPRPSGHHARGPTHRQRAGRVPIPGRRRAVHRPLRRGQPHGTTSSRDGPKPRHAHLRQPRPAPRLLLRPRQGPVPARDPGVPAHVHPGPDSLRRPLRQHCPHRRPHRHPPP